jgi:hypothetical protein
VAKKAPQKRELERSLEAAYAPGSSVLDTAIKALWTQHETSRDPTLLELVEILLAARSPANRGRLANAARRLRNGDRPLRGGRKGNKAEPWPTVALNAIEAALRRPAEADERDILDAFEEAIRRGAGPLPPGADILIDWEVLGPALDEAFHSIKEDDLTEFQIPREVDRIFAAGLRALYPKENPHRHLSFRRKARTKKPPRKAA